MTRELSFTESNRPWLKKEIPTPYLHSGIFNGTPILAYVIELYSQVILSDCAQVYD